MGNHNYAQIELFDSYLLRKCETSVPELAKNLQKNQGTNLTNVPFSAQPNDARHKEFNLQD